MSEPAQVPAPPLDHDCCPCAERLRGRSKQLSDEWTRRTADMLRRKDYAEWWIGQATDLILKLGMDAPATRAVVAALLQRQHEMTEEIGALNKEVRRERRLNHASRRKASTKPQRAAEDEALLARETAYMKGYEAGLSGRAAEVHNA